MPQYEAYIKDQLKGNTMAQKKEQSKYDAFKEHFNALTKHISNTQTYLLKEAQ